jgi:hypothetical protein
MKNLFMLVGLVNLWCAILCGSENSFPGEIDYNRACQQAKVNYDRAIKTARDRFIIALKAEIDRLTKKGDLDGTLAIRSRIQNIGAELPQGPPANEPDMILPPRSNSRGVLTGTQQEDVLTLVTGQVYQIDQEFLVPAGKTLEIENGVTVVVNAKGQLTISGKFHVRGTPKLPVTIKGRTDVSGSWKGLCLNKAEEVNISYIKISGADTGVIVQECNSTLSGCVVFNNRVGCELIGKAILNNCLITQNKENGLFIHHGTVEVESCTIIQNNVGMEVNYGGNAVMTKSIISTNKQAGVIHRLGSIAAHQCYFDNKTNVINTTSDDSDFTVNWWGETNTQLLRSGLTIPGIQNSGSGKVRLSDFLVKSPMEVGANLEKLHAISLP